jgi:hypothetical protein
MAVRIFALGALLLGLSVAAATVTAAQEDGSMLPTVIDWPEPVVAPDLLTNTVLPVAGGLVAVGQEQDGTTTRAAAWWSADGNAWERTVLDGPEGGYAAMRDVVEIPTGLVAMGPYGIEQCSGSGEGGVTCEPSAIAVWRSADGRTWKHVDTQGSGVARSWRWRPVRWACSRSAWTVTGWRRPGGRATGWPGRPRASPAMGSTGRSSTMSRSRRMAG